jgi:lysyl-tRNA synthetase class II
MRELLLHLNGSLQFSASFNGHECDLNFSSEFKRIAVIPALESRFGIDLSSRTSDAQAVLSRVIQSEGLTLPVPPTLSRMYDLLISKYLEKECIQPTVLFGHPVACSPLAKSAVSPTKGRMESLQTASSCSSAARSLSIPIRN